jgi:hypothetical protein
MHLALVGHAAGSMGAVDREPVEMSLVSGERAAATTAHLVRLVCFTSDWIAAACGAKPTSAAALANVCFLGAKQTFDEEGRTSAYDPKQTSECTDATKL